MKARIEAEAALMRSRAELLPGSGGSKYRGKQVWTEKQQKLRREIKTLQQHKNREYVRCMKLIGTPN